MSRQSPIAGTSSGEGNPGARAQPPSSGLPDPAPNRVPVLVDYSLDEHLLEQIAAVDPRVLVMPAFRRVASEKPGTSLENWSRLDEAELEPLLAQAEVLFAFRFPIEWLEKAPHLRCVQLASAGSDHMQDEGIFTRRPDLLLTTASGVHAIPISEHILAMILFFARKFNIAVRAQAAHEWKRFRGGEAAGKTVCIVGYGPIGRRTAQLCCALGMTVLVVRASIDEEQPGDEQVERFYPSSRLNAALSASDYVALAAPLTPDSRGMIGEAQFAAMKPEAVLINISRGELVDEGALVAALEGGRIAGAGLDVFAQEPLPESSPLWSMPNVLITPHNSGSNPYYNERAVAIFADNLARYMQGEPLKNKVDKERGY